MTNYLLETKTGGENGFKPFKIERKKNGFIPFKIERKKNGFNLLNTLP